MKNQECIHAFIEQVVEHLIKQEAPSSANSIETYREFQARRKLRLTDLFTATFERALRGYRCLRDCLSQDQRRDMSLYELPLDRLVTVDLNEQVLLFKVFGYTQEVLGAFYQEACKLYEKRRYEDALDAFTFLSLLSPLAPDVWMALALSFSACKKEPEAQEAKELANYLKE